MTLEAVGLTRAVGDGASRRTLFEDVSLRVAPGEVLFIVGARAAPFRPRHMRSCDVTRSRSRRARAQAPAAWASRCSCAPSRA
jgi:hypothetical protein